MIIAKGMYTTPENTRYLVEKHKQSESLQYDNYGTYYIVTTLEEYRDKHRFAPTQTIYVDKDKVFTLLGQPKCSRCGKDLGLNTRIYCNTQKKSKIRENPTYCRPCKKKRLQKKKTAEQL